MTHIRQQQISSLFLLLNVFGLSHSVSAEQPAPLLPDPLLTSDRARYIFAEDQLRTKSPTRPASFERATRAWYDANWKSALRRGTFRTLIELQSSLPDEVKLTKYGRILTATDALVRISGYADSALDAFNQHFQRQREAELGVALRELATADVQFRVRNRGFLTPDEQLSLTTEYSERLRQANHEPGELHVLQANFNDIVTTQLRYTADEVVDVKTRLEDVEARALSVDKWKTTASAKLTELESMQRRFSSKLDQVQRTVARHDRELQNLKADSDEHRQRIDRNSAELAFLKDMAWSKLSPKEQLQALESGLYGQDLEDDKRDLLETKLQLQSITADAAKHLSGVGSFLNATASALNVELPKPVAKALSIGSSLSSAASAFASGEYLSAATAVIGLFGRKRDVATERHQQLVAHLAAIDAKVSQVLENQKEMMRALDRLGEQLARAEENILIQLRIINLKTDIAMNVLFDSVSQPVRVCTQFAYGVPDIDAPLFAMSMLERRRHYRDNARKAEICFGELGLKWLLDADSPEAERQMNPYLLSSTAAGRVRLAALSGVADQALRFEVDVFAPLLSTWEQFGSTVAHGSPNDMTDDVRRVWFDTVFGPESAWEMRDLTPNPEFQAPPWSYRRDPLGLLLDAQRTAEVAGLALKLHYYFAIRHPVENRLVSPSESSNPALQSGAEVGREILESALSAVQINLAQLRLLAGVPMLRSLYARLGLPEHSGWVQELCKHQLIRTNLGMYFVAERLAQCAAEAPPPVQGCRLPSTQRRGDWVRYEYAHTSGDSMLLEYVLGPAPQGFAYRCERPSEGSANVCEMYLQEGGLSVPLPGAYASRCGRFVFPPRYEHLTELETDLISEISTYHTGSFDKTDNEIVDFYRSISVPLTGPNPMAGRTWSVAFGVGESRIDAQGGRDLKEVCNLWKETGRSARVHVVGYASPAGASRQFNLKVAAARADNVRKQLVACGVELTLLDVGHPEVPDIATLRQSGDTVEAARRVDVYLLE